MFANVVMPKMAERNAHLPGFSFRSPKCCFFTLLIVVCVSWFFFLGSTGRSYLIDTGLVSNSKLRSTIEIQKVQPNILDVLQSSHLESAALLDVNGRGGDELEKCDPSNAALKVFMYDLPPEFHFGLLGWKPEGDSVWPDIATKIPDYPGGLNLQHSIEYPPNVANVDKDFIAPYKHMIKTYANDLSTYDDRPTLLYFQGAIYRKDGGFIHQELFYLLKDEKDVHFSFGSVRENGINNASQGMHSSKFCLNIAGDTPSSNRLFDAIASHCVPVIISDEIELPFEDVLNYSEFCIFVRTSDALKKGFLMKLVRNVSPDEWTRMWSRLREVEGYFEYQYPSKKNDAVQMIWQFVARKVPMIKLKINRSRRFFRFDN